MMLTNRHDEGAPIRTRTPVRGPALTELGLGTSGFGNLFYETSDEATRDAVDAAWAGGMRYFDTAPHYGLGLYEISVAQLPRLLRGAVAWVLPPGDLERGLDRLRMAAERGTLLRPLAQMALFTVLVNGQQRYAEAAALGQALLDRYPNNPALYFPLALSYSETGQHGEALKVARQLWARLEAGAPPFRREILPRYHQLMGKLYMDMGEHATALRFFQRAIDHGNTAYAWVTAWAWTRSGLIFDLQGEREEAVRRYREALGVQTEGLARDVARRHLETPYRGRPRPAS